MAGDPVRSVQGGEQPWQAVAKMRTIEASKFKARIKRIAGCWECRAAENSAKAMSTSLLWNLSMIELPEVVEDGMSGRNGQRKPGTARGSRRRSFGLGARSGVNRRAQALRLATDLWQPATKLSAKRHIGGADELAASTGADHLQ